jgi:hypothetical protein
MNSEGSDSIDTILLYTVPQLCGEPQIFSVRLPAFEHRLEQHSVSQLHRIIINKVLNS